MKKIILLLVLLLAMMPTFVSNVYAVAFGILGDSNSDEYRANDNRGGAYASTTFNWMEQLVRTRQLYFGAWGTRAEPRRTGYAYNWARSGATASSMVSGGQVSGLAQQVSIGQVSYAIIFVGFNDFSILIGTYQEIYNNQVSDARLQSKVNQIIANITYAVNTLHNAGALGIIVTTIADPGIADIVKAKYRNATQRQRVTNAINAVNIGIRKLASSKVSINEWGVFAESIVTENIITVGGVQIQVNGVGNKPHNLSLADMHAGTIFSGLIANSIFIEPLNQAYNLGITPLSDQEILQNAGLKPRYVSEVPQKRKSIFGCQRT